MSKKLTNALLTAAAVTVVSSLTFLHNWLDAKGEEQKLIGEEIKHKLTIADQAKQIQLDNIVIQTNAQTISVQANTINHISHNGLAPAGTFKLDLLDNITNFLHAQLESPPANLIIIEDLASYGCVSHPEEYDQFISEITNFANGIMSSPTIVKMLFYSDSYASNVVSLQFTASTWQSEYISDAHSREKLRHWFKRDDVQTAISPLNIDAAKLGAYERGSYRETDLETFKLCTLTYNTYMKEFFARNGVKVYSYDEPMSLHLWLIDKQPDDDKIAGIISLADWISSIDEPGFYVRNLTYNQINAIANKIIARGTPE
jgi:hypothetical protein